MEEVEASLTSIVIIILATTCAVAAIFEVIFSSTRAYDAPWSAFGGRGEIFYVREVVFYP